jgi:hypothetical protein
MTIAELEEKNITELSRIARSLLGRGASRRSCAFGWLAHSRNFKPRLLTEDTLSTEETSYVLQHIDLADT